MTGIATVPQLLREAEQVNPMAGTIYRHGAAADAETDDIAIAGGLRVPVLISGGSGADREACARLIHASGSCVKGPFVPLRRLAETSRNRYDGSDALRHCFAQARGGTLFIDNLAFLSSDAQGALFSLLQDDKGGGAVRVISGTGGGTVDERAFPLVDERLFYRLNIIRIDLR